MVHKILTIWDATCTTAATLLSLLLLAAVTVLSTSVLVEDSAVGDKAAMLMAALLVSLLLPSIPVVAFEASQTTSAVPLEEVAPLPVSGGVAPGGIGGSGIVNGALSINSIVVDGGINGDSRSGIGGSGIVVNCVCPRRTFSFRSTGLLSVIADGATPFWAAFASHGGSIVCCWIWFRMVKVAQKGKDSGSWTLPK